MTVNLIQQRHTSGPPELEKMADGELFLDEAAQIIWTLGETERVQMKLGGQGLPDLSYDDDTVVVQGPDGLTYGVLRAGAGGQPLPVGQWCVPGLTPRTVVTQTFAAEPYEFFVEVNEPLQFEAFKLGAPDEVPFEVRSPSGEVVGLDEDLAPGLYTVTLTPAAPVSIICVVGALPYRAEQACPVWFKLKEIPDAG